MKTPPETGPVTYPAPPPVQVPRSLRRMRIAVSAFYFGQGVAFASWASRIPDIKAHLGLSDGALGTTLLALPLGQLCTMPFSGRLVSRLGSRAVLIVAALAYVLALCNLGLANHQWQLVLGLFLFGIAGNMSNISVNTQGVEAERLFGRPIMTSFHGAWSIGGFAGALLGQQLMQRGFRPEPHFWVVAALVGVNVWLNQVALVRESGRVIPPPDAQAAALPKRRFRLPSGILLQLGVIGFCSMGTEGCMFEWSGVYLRDIAKVAPSQVGLGFTSFMIMMASGRFLGDWVINRIGRRKVLIGAGIIISTGMAVAVLFPQLYPTLAGFMLVGIGVSTIVPSIYSIAGQQKELPASVALATVSSVSYFGFLMGPPLIGYLSELSSLRLSFAVIGCFGIIVAALVGRFRGLSE